MKLRKLYERSYLMWPLCLLLLYLQVPGAQSAPEPDPGKEKIRLSEAISRISERYHVLFNYDRKLVAGVEVTYREDQDKGVRETISEVLRETDLRFKIFDERYVVLYKKDQEGMRSLRKMVDHFQQILEDNEAEKQQHRQPVPEEPEPEGRQGLEVGGTVTGEDGEPLTGVSVLVKGTSKGASTGPEGRYTLQDVEEDAVLVFLYLGYETREVPVEGRPTIDVVLVEDSEALEEVVVTAFGIEREKKALSYSVQEVDGDQLAAVGNTNVVNSLQGKVAGLIVKQISGAPGSRSRISIRGSRSFVGNNEPLYVIDGLPVSSGSRAIDINPNDVESVNVLKGPTAAALYGLRASNGVVVIETKKGEGAEGRPRITLESSYNFDQLSRKPGIQTTYAQGEGGQFSPFSAFSWGPRIDTLGTYINQLGEPEEAAVYDNVGDLFRTGGTANTNLSIANRFDRGNYSVGLGFADQQGILGNTSMQRINVKLAGSYDISEKLRIGSSVNYANSAIEGVNFPMWGTFAVPSSYNLKGKPTHDPEDPFRQINFRGQHDNFYWAMDNNYSDNNTSRVFGNVSFDYEVADWLSVGYRIGLDYYDNLTKTVNEKGSGSGRTDPPSGGSISNNKQTHQQINSNLNITLNRDLGEDFNLELMAGNEFYDIRTNRVQNAGSDIIIGGFHHISNTATQTTDENLNRSRVIGFYGNLSLSWRDAVFLNASGRNDKVSNMPRENRSFFYPSVGLGVVFTDLLHVPEHILSFGKLRASIAEVGQAGPVYATATLFNPGPSAGGFTWPYQGLNAFNQANQINSSNLQPENTRTLELGVELRFFNDRVGLDYTWYDSKAKGQIYQVPVAFSTGFSSELRNAGEMSIKGHEIMLNVTPVMTRDFHWDLTANFTAYRNRVISLAEGIGSLELAGDQSGFLMTTVAQPGEEFPSLRAFGYARDPQSGEIVVDSRPELPDGDPNPQYGMPLRSTDEIILGSAQPDFEMTFINQLSFKGISFSAQIDWRQGGILSSGYNRLGKLYGILTQTENREADHVVSGKKGYYEGGELVVEGDNDITIRRGEPFYRNEDIIRESSVYDATYVRLREVRIGYQIPQNWFQNTFIQSASVFLTGRNLWLNAKVPHFDPEMFNQSEGESYNTYPQTKSFGGGINVNF